MDKISIKNKYNIYQRKWRDANRDKLNAYLRSYYQKTKMKRRESTIKSTSRLRPMLFDILGRHCSRCGFSDIRALQFDHKNGGGNKEVKMYKSNHSMIRMYIKNPCIAKEKLQVLCANCNWIKKYENNEKRK